MDNSNGESGGNWEELCSILKLGDIKVVAVVGLGAESVAMRLRSALPCVHFRVGRLNRLVELVVLGKEWEKEGVLSKIGDSTLLYIVDLRV